MKYEELRMATAILEKVCEACPTMFDEDGRRKSVYSYDEIRTMRIRPTQAKADIKYVRRLLMEVAKEL